MPGRSGIAELRRKPGNYSWDMASEFWEVNRAAAIEVAERGSCQPVGILDIGDREDSVVVDVDFLNGAHAAVWFLTRARGALIDETFLLHKVEGRWKARMSHNAGGAHAKQARPPLAEVPERVSLSPCAIGYRGGGTGGIDGSPSSQHFVLAREVTELRFSDGRAPKQVAMHGHAVVLFAHDGLVVSACNEVGECVGQHTCNGIRPREERGVLKRLGLGFRRNRHTYPRC